MIHPCEHRVRELLTYSHNTKVFRWKRKPFGLKGIGNPYNIAGAIDLISKRKVINVDGFVHFAADLVKFFPIAKKKKTNFPKPVESQTGITWSPDKRKWRVRLYLDKKSFSLGCVKDYTEAIFIRLAGEQCLKWKPAIGESQALNFCKKLVPHIN